MRPATITATFSDLRDFLRFSKAYPKTLVKELDKLLVKLRGREAVETSQRFVALANIDVTTIRPRSDEILHRVSEYANPAKRHIQRNRAMAVAVPPLTPLRREWHDLRFGRDLVWAEALAARPDLAPALGFHDCLAWAGRLAADPKSPGTAAAEPALRRMADGLAYRARALRLLGNGVHPLAAAHAWRSLAAAHGLGPVGLAIERGVGRPGANEPL